jgi:predicted nucleic-acid-binding protein
MATEYDVVKITHDIVVDGKYAFLRNEEVLVELVRLNAERPEYKYVIHSLFLNKRFQLREEDIAPIDAVEILCSKRKRFIPCLRHKGREWF